jgi:hypothetical protein
LRKTYAQTVFKVGFDQTARLRDYADALARIPAFQLTMLDAEDQEFVEALRRFKPLLIESGHYRNFRSLADVENARTRLQALHSMTKAFLDAFPSPQAPFARTFNTAAVRLALSGEASTAPLSAEELRSYVAGGIRQPEIQLPEALQPFAEKWWNAFRAEMEPLAGKKIDPRYVASVLVKL